MLVRWQSVIYLFRTLLAVIIVANCLGLVTLYGNAQILLNIYPEFRSWMIPVLVLSSLASILACGALWNWRRWGLGLLFGAYLLMLVINLRISAPISHTWLGPIGLIALTAAWWPIRKHFPVKKINGVD